MKQTSIIEKINTRSIFSKFSGSMVYFMDSLANVEELEKAKAKGYKAFSDGLCLIDLKAGKEGKLAHMYAVLKNNERKNLFVFLCDAGFFKSAISKDQIFKSLNSIQTRRTYIKRNNLNLEL